VDDPGAGSDARLGAGLRVSRAKRVASVVVSRTIRVMVVDDTDHVRRMLTSMLSLDGYEVVGEVASGPAALEAVVAADPDIVVIDYKMPGMDGLDTARGIRQRRPDQVMILYTAYIDEALEKAAADAGISLCIGKVDGLSSLEREINRLCASLF
jgi:CheY-like chemotaxis protein